MWIVNQMNLERNQSQHDEFISNSHNISGSNDAKQIPNDATEHLIRGAKLIVEGRERGLTDDQIVDEAMNTSRKSQSNSLSKSIRRS